MHTIRHATADLFSVDGQAPETLAAVRLRAIHANNEALRRLVEFPRHVETLAEVVTGQRWVRSIITPGHGSSLDVLPGEFFLYVDSLNPGDPRSSANTNGTRSRVGRLVGDPRAANPHRSIRLRRLFGTDRVGVWLSDGSYIGDGEKLATVPMAQAWAELLEVQP